MSGGAPNPVMDRLGFRLGLVLSMALVPVGVLALLQSDKIMQSARTSSEAALKGETLRAVIPEMQVLQQAQGAARAVARTVLALSADSDRCDTVLRNLVDGGKTYASAVFVGADGGLRCASSRDPAIAAVPGGIAALAARPLPSFNPGPESASGSASVLAVYPVRDDAGQPAGAVALSVAAHGLSVAPNATRPQSTLSLVVFNPEGQVLASSLPTAEMQGLLPRDSDLAKLATAGEAIFTGPSASGAERAFSVVGLGDPGLLALGSWPTRATAVSALPTLPAAGFPVLMWVVSLIAAYVAAELLVTRHIRDLRRAIMKFARGQRTTSLLNMANAPREIRDTSDAFQQMTLTILRDEADLEHSLREKETLLREVHHRVKNNLQLVVSIINMQMRETSSGEARALMRAVQDRVISLATVHKDLYQTSDLTSVRADQLLPEIVNQVISLGPGTDGPLDLRVDFVEVSLTQEQAVPLALLLAEALTHARNEAAEEPGVPQLEISLQREDGNDAILTVQHAVEPSALVAPGRQLRSGLGRHLIDAFAAQLEGTVSFDETSTTHRLQVRFPLADTGPGPAPAPQPGPRPADQ